MSDDIIISELRNSGWQEMDIQGGLAETGGSAPNIQIPPKILSQQLPGAQTRTFWQKFKLSIMIGGIVIILTAGGYLAYTYYFNSPQKILQKAISNMVKVESGHIKFEATISEKIAKSESSTKSSFFDLFGVNNFTITFGSNGGYKSTADTYDYDGVITVGIKTLGVNFSFDIELKKIGKDYFVKVADNPLSQSWARRNLLPIGLRLIRMI